MYAPLSTVRTAFVLCCWFIAEYTKLCLCLLDLQNVLHMFDMEGTFLKDFPLAVGTVTGYSGRKKDSEVRPSSSC